MSTASNSKTISTGSSSKNISSQKSSGSPREGRIARTIEEQTAHVPSDLFLWGAVGAMAMSLGCHMCGARHTGLFFGQWAAPLLLFGVYNKIVKVAGSDQFTAPGGTQAVS